MIDKKRIENVALDLYKKHSKTGSPASKMLKIIEKENILFTECAISNKNFLGALINDNTNPLHIIINSGIKPNGKRNFTIAHELGHYALGHHLSAQEFFCDEDKIKENGDATDKQEKEANYFASYFLLQTQRLTNEFTKQFRWNVSQAAPVLLLVDFTDNEKKKLWGKICGILKKDFGVSEYALKIRLVELELINDFDY